MATGKATLPDGKELILTDHYKEGLMKLPAASCGVSKTERNEASFGEFTLSD